MYTYYYTYIYISLNARKISTTTFSIKVSRQLISTMSKKSSIIHHHGIIARNDKVEFTYLRQTAGGQQTILDNMFLVT